MTHQRDVQPGRTLYTGKVSTDNNVKDNTFGVSLTKKADVLQISITVPIKSTHLLNFTNLINDVYPNLDDAPQFIKVLLTEFYKALANEDNVPTGA